MTRLPENPRDITHIFIFLSGLLFVLFINGALPFFSSPTLAQVFWSTGFAQSYLNNSLLTVYATNFGAPEPAAIAFGLAGAWLSAVFMHFGLSAIDSYTMTAALWFTVSFIAAYKIGRLFDVSPSLSVLGALTWGTTPMIVWNSGYSMLSMGIALLPMYMLFAFKLFRHDIDIQLGIPRLIFKLFFPYLLICLIAIFMDGYSFMMFVTGSTIFGIVALVAKPDFRKNILTRFCVHFICLGISYLLFIIFIGKYEFRPGSIDFFRGFGADIIFLLRPSNGIHWIPDLLGWSESRSSKEFFGNASVWTTSFSLPIIIGAILATLFAKKSYIKYALLFITIFGFYMALGPSIKFNSLKPVDYVGGPAMDKVYAIAPTGSTVLSKNLPGFKSMRASYRWGAVGVFGAWALIMLGASRQQKETISKIAGIILTIVAILNLPNLPKTHIEHKNNRSIFYEIDAQLTEDLRYVLKPKEIVAFLPWGNDFLINYIASKLDIITYNIGGDKNLRQAIKHWPKTMRRFPKGRIDSNFSRRVLLLFAKGEVDAVVLPYISMLWAAHRWPYPLEFKDDLEPIEYQLRTSGFVSVEKREYYSVVRLKPEYIDLIGTKEFKKRIKN